MTKISIDYLCYCPTQYPVQDIARLVVHSNLWADYRRKILKDFNAAVNSKFAWGAISEWVDGFNHSVGTPLFSSYVAIADNQPVGFVATGHDVWDDSQQTGEIKSLSVHPDYWGQGIGTRLLTAAEMFLQSVNCRRITLLVEPDNKRAFGLYKKEGWKHVDGVYHCEPVNGRTASFYGLEKRF
jgi:ribosomal protein S18 acetylase RimI-like enzyme